MSVPNIYSFVKWDDLSLILASDSMHPMLCCVAKQERCRAFLFPGMRKIEDCLPEIREIWPKMMFEACWIVLAWGPINFKEPLHIGKKGALSSML